MRDTGCFGLDNRHLDAAALIDRFKTWAVK